MRLSVAQAYINAILAGQAGQGDNLLVNGWRFWQCRLPGSSEPVLIERLRGKVY